MNIREAAQALLDALDRPGLDTTLRWAMEDVARELAAPPEPGWGEGAEAMRKAMAKMLRSEERRHSSVRAKDALITAHTLALILPVPDAPTHAAPEADPYLCPVPNCHAGMLRDHDGRDSVSCPVCDGTITADGYRSLEKTHGVVVRRPEAKTAESEVLAYKMAIVRAARALGAEQMREAAAAYVYACEESNLSHIAAGIRALPAPVEPEETP